MVLANGSLLFTQVTSGSAAVNSTYQCVANNRAGVIRSPLVSVGVAEWTDQFVLEPTPTTAIAGLNVTLECTPPHSIPKASVKWLKNYAPVQTRQDISILASGDLWIGDVKESDEGGYRCAAENTVLHLSAVTNEAKLTVHVRPQILVKSPDMVTVILGSLLCLNCSASGSPEPGIQWQLNGKPLMQDNNITLNTEFLMIQSVSLKGEGTYECIASNAAGSVRTEVFVDVQVPPVITTAPLDTIVYEGSSLSLLCVASGDPKPVIQWSGPMLDSYHGNELNLTSINRTQEGVYTCKAVSVAGSVAAVALVDVQYAPQIIFITDNMTVISSNEVNFTCLADADPISNVTWQRSSSVLGVSSNNSATLHIGSVQPSDDGEYYCVAINSLGQASSVRTLTVHVGPQILVPPSDVTLKIRATLSLPCQPFGIPTPRLTWLKANNLQNETLSVASDGTLTITDVSIYHSGTYICIVSNIVGSTNRSANVVVQGLSDRPRDLQAVAISSREIELKWTPPLFTGNSAILTYILRYRVAGRENWDIALQLASLPPTFLLDSLTPYTKYEIAVAAENSVGTSHLSNMTVVTTHQAAPAVPDIDEATNISENGVQITWLTPQPINGILQLYELRYSKYGSTNSSILKVDSEANNVTVFNLIPFTIYIFSLRASTGNESVLLWSNWSFPVHVRTQEGVPLESPQNLSLTVLSSRAFSLQWMAPNFDTVQGFIWGYHVYYRVLEGNNSVSIANTPSSQNTSISYVLFGLRPYTRYTISVAVYNSVTSGPPSREVSGQTMEDVPDSAPTLVSVTTSGPQSLDVAFLPPPLNTHNGILRGYQIFYRHLSESSFNKDIIYENGTVLLSRRNHTISNLKSYSLYEINMNAFTRAGDSPASRTMVVRTGEGIPSPPTSVQAISVSFTTAILTWQLPDFVNGVLLYYTVYYHPVQSDGSLVSFQDQSNETLITLTDLMPNTPYKISVTATTGYGEGEPSNPLSIKTDSFPTTQPVFVFTTGRNTKAPTVSVTRIATTPSEQNMTSPLPTSSGDSEDTATQRTIVIASSILGVIFLITIIIMCGLCCVGKDGKRSHKCCPSLHHERKRNKYKIPHYDGEDSDVGDPSWALSTGDNFTFRKRDEFISFHDSYLPEPEKNTEEDVKGSHEMLELGYDVSPMIQFEADAGYSSFKGERPPSIPGPSPYSSQEIAAADQLPSRYEDEVGFEEDTLDSGL
jgi:hypothetical protein